MEDYLRNMLENIPRKEAEKRALAIVIDNYENEN